LGKVSWRRAGTLKEKRQSKHERAQGPAESPLPTAGNEKHLRVGGWVPTTHTGKKRGYGREEGNLV